MKRLLILIPVILFLCGCTANYEITIKNNKISEKLTIVETDSSVFDVANDMGWTIRESFESLFYEDEFSEELYNVESLNNDSQLGVKISNNSDIELSSSSIINQCYTEPEITERDGIVEVYTGYDFQCYEFYDNLKSVVVTLKTNHKVLSHNADSVENGKYIWNLTKDGNKLIEFSYDTSVKKSNLVNYIVIITIIVLALGVLYYVNYKRKKNNEI